MTAFEGKYRIIFELREHLQLCFVVIAICMPLTFGQSMLFYNQKMKSAVNEISYIGKVPAYNFALFKRANYYYLHQGMQHQEWK